MTATRASRPPTKSQHEIGANCSQPGTGIFRPCAVMASKKPKTDFSKIGDILSENFSTLSLMMKVMNFNRRIG
ncbi:MAG: hypothetical protein M0Q93_06495 [Terrimicrobiaceae bacterium]|nr:hypothetical protein [Terrimicrobiaceae bacterium]